jgi:hypothetical protein
MIVGCRIIVNLRSHYQQRRKKIGRSFGSPLGNDRPITWAVNGFGHQLRLILSLSPFVDLIHACKVGTMPAPEFGHHGSSSLLITVAAALSALAPQANRARCSDESDQKRRP